MNQTTLAIEETLHLSVELWYAKYCWGAHARDHLCGNLNKSEVKPLNMFMGSMRKKVLAGARIFAGMTYHEY